MAKTKKGDAPQNPVPGTVASVKAHYIKSSDFRTVFVNGGIGGITPNGGINLNVYTHRNVIPQVSTLEVEGTTINEKMLETKEGFVREVPFGMVFDLNSAIAIRDWLTSQITLLQEYQKQAITK